MQDTPKKKRGRPPKDRSIEGQLREQLANIDKEIASIKAAAGPATAISAMYTQRIRVFDRLAQITGERDVTEAQILKSRAWLRLMNTISDILAPWPDAMRALGEKLLEHRDDGK